MFIQIVNRVAVADEETDDDVIVAGEEVAEAEEDGQHPEGNVEDNYADLPVGSSHLQR